MLASLETYKAIPYYSNLKDQGDAQVNGSKSITTKAQSGFIQIDRLPIDRRILVKNFLDYLSILN